MTSEEIKATDCASNVGGGFDAGRAEFWLREIALQLALFQEHLREADAAVFGVRENKTCEAQRGVFMCTLRFGHTGDHEAGIMGGKTAEKWPR